MSSATTPANASKAAPKWTPARVIAAGFLLCVGLGFLVFGMSDESIGKRDYPEFWAAGQQLVHGGNPYDMDAILRLQRIAGSTRAQSHPSFSPPFALIFALPLGFFSSKTGAILWMLAIACCLMASLQILKSMYGTADSRIHLVGYLFAPVLACLMIGQLDVFLLLGLVLFLEFHQSRPFLAGAALLPFATKPHLILPFFLVLLVWSVFRKNYRVILGGISAMAANILLITWADPHAWSQYRAMMGEIRPMGLFIPAWSVMFRVMINQDWVWLQFVPVTLGSVWALWYFWTRRAEWKWTEQGLLLLLVSVVFAPYAWFYDEAILLPAMLASLFRAEESERSLAPFGLIALAALLEVMWRVDIAAKYYLWTAPAWFAWYLFAMRGRELPSGISEPELSSAD